MMKFFWYLSSVLTVLLILINNPKAINFGSSASASQLFSYTKSAQTGLQLATIAVSSVFLFLTVVLTSHFFM